MVIQKEAAVVNLALNIHSERKGKIRLCLTFKGRFAQGMKAFSQYLFPSHKSLARGSQTTRHFQVRAATEVQ